MTRVKTFDSTGLATSGRLYAGDLNLIQDQYADLVNYAQTHGVGLLAVGDATLQLLKYGTGEMRLTGHVRTDGILRALGGLFGGTFTTTQRDAIASGSRPYGLVIINSTTNRPEWNAGTDASPNWQPIGITTIPSDSITAVELANGSVGQNELATNAVIAVKVDGTLKPSVSAAAGTEALRALGTTAATAAAGNDSRLSDVRTPADGSVTLVKVAGSLKPSGTAATTDESLRAIGTTASTAAAGNDARLSDARTPSDGSVTLVKLAAALKPSGSAAAGDEAVRALGTSGATAAAGNDARLSDQRTPTDASVTAAKLAAQTIDVKGTNYTLVLTDRYKLIRMDGGGTLTIPTNATAAFAVGDTVDMIQWGASQVTIAGSGGVTVVGNPGLKTIGQYTMATVIKIATDTWVAVGALTP